MKVTKRDLDAILTVASILFLGLTPEEDDKKMFKELREISNIADELDSRMLCSEANMLDSILKNSNLNSAGLMSLPLKNGDRGRLVYNAQAKLLQYGYHMDAGADGIFGKQTEAAIKEFQAENNFNETGLLTRGQYNLLVNGEPNKASYKRVIVAIGDSITAGGYARNLQTKVPGSRTFTFGYGGKQTGFIKKKMSLALDKNPSDIIILAGALEDPFSTHNLRSRIPTLIRRFVNKFKRSQNVTSFQTLESTMTVHGALKLLGVPIKAGSSLTLTFIREAYKTQAILNHPDSGGTNETMRKLNEAYQLLKDLYKN